MKAEEAFEKEFGYKPQPIIDDIAWMAGYNAAKPEWINVHHRLPDNGWYLCFITHTQTMIAVKRFRTVQMRDGIWQTRSIGGFREIVTLWQPILPTNEQGE